MKLLKKFSALSLSAALLLAGCGSSPAGTTDGTGQSAPGSTADVDPRIDLTKEGK